MLPSKNQEPDAADLYLDAYAEKKELDTLMKAAKKKLAAAKGDFVTFVTELNTQTIKRDGQSVSHSRRTFGSVKDFGKLMEWVRDQEEPNSLYTEEVFIKGSKSDQRGIHLMILDAQKRSLDDGKPVLECLPPGLEVAVVDVVTVRESKKTEADIHEEKLLNAVEELKRQMEDAE